MADEQVGGYEPAQPAPAGDATNATFDAPNNNVIANPTPQRVVKRRNRKPVVCKPCRDRRSKCNRATPCEHCVKRDEAHLCIYAEQPDKTRNAASRVNKTATSRAKQLEKIAQLETALKRIAPILNQTGRKDHYGTNAQQQQPTPATTEGDSQLAALDASGIPHWVAVLRELKSSIEGYDDATSDVDDGVVASEEQPLLLGTPNPPLLSDVIRQYLSNKDEIDKRVTDYFEATFLVIPVIHKGKFAKEYDLFWAAAAMDSADPIWTALLFGILSLSALILAGQGNEEELTKCDAYISATAQCLNIGGYLKPRSYLIPALLLFTQSLYMRYQDPSREVAAIIPLVVRLAFQSGLNREPGPQISIFEGEIRRRLWVMIRHLDRQVACQFGVPASVQSSAADVQPPHNLSDEDLTEDMTHLPQSRPLTDYSAVSTFIIKNKLMAIFDEIYSFAFDFRRGQDDDAETKRLAGLLKAEWEEIPEAYKAKPMAMSVTDNPSLRMSRVTLEFLYQKCIILLHRRRMARQLDFDYKATTKAAKSIIATFQDLLDAFAPGKLMEGRSWMLSATIVCDFLLACMTLAMASYTGPQDIEENFTALENAYQLCASLTGKSRGAQRVLNAISTVLQRAGRNPSLPVDPRMQQPAIPQGYQPAPSYTTYNGYGPANPSTGSHPPPTPTSFQGFPTPAPSSALSEERSTSHGAQSQQSFPNAGQMPYAGSLATTWTNNPMPVFEGQPMMPGLFPSNNQHADPLQRQLTNAIAQYGQTQGQYGGQFSQAGGIPGGDPFQSLNSLNDLGNLDWSVFDQYILE